MEGLLAIIVVVAVIVAIATLWPRLARSGAGQPDLAGRGPEPPATLAPARPDDPDQVDEASLLLAAIGGQLRPGDAVIVPIDDPAVWHAASFELNLSIDAVSQAEIRDRSGLFSFWLYWFQAGQEADLLMVEGDAPALSEAFVGRRLTDEALVGTLQWCRDRYLAETAHDQVDFDLGDHELGQWTAFGAREGGNLRVTAGQAPLLAAGSAVGSGLPYRDFSLRPTEGVGNERLRLLQVGSYTYLFRGEIVRLGALQFLRRRDRGA